MVEDTPKRFEEEIVMTTSERGRLIVKMIDRINVDDVFLHLISVELFRISTGLDPGPDVSPLYKEFLLKERFTAGQG